MMLARHLDRTLVIPPFYRHHFAAERMNNDGDMIVDAQSRVNIEKIREYLSTVPLETMKKHCEKIDIQLISKPLIATQRKQRVQEFIDYTGYNLFFSNIQNSEDIPKLPKSSPSDGITGQIEDRQFWQNLYNSDGKCAVLVLPYMMMKYTNAWNHNNTETDHLVWELLDHVRMSDHIFQLRDLFISEHFGGIDYLAVHWRFDPQDWGRGCYRKSSNNSRENHGLCKLLDMANKDIAGALLFHLARKMDNQHDLGNLVNTGIYIASPPKSQKKIEDVLEHVKRFWLKTQSSVQDFRIYSTSYLEKWIKFRFPECSLAEDSETISMLEQAIAMESFSFINAQSSSWSYRVVTHRKLARKTLWHDASISSAIDAYNGVFSRESEGKNPQLIQTREIINQYLEE